MECTPSELEVPGVLFTQMDNSVYVSKTTAKLLFAVNYNTESRENLPSG